ncbi:MAG: hypothetical protein IK130_10500 [Oscillospiraceae bacterium]|nr:hypothetical protein [Oscillospiraceae bacterium]
MNKSRRFPLIAGILFLLLNVIVVAYAWVSGVHLYDFGISFSAYVGLQRWTSVMYFVFAVIMIALLAVYVLKTKIRFIKKILYGIIFICIFGTAFFPFNTFSAHPTALTVDLHNDFAIGLMLATTVSFILSLILSKTRKHKITALLSLLFAAGFIACYFSGIPLLFSTFFIWENAFIILLLLELYMEQFEEDIE